MRDNPRVVIMDGNTTGTFSYSILYVPLHVPGVLKPLITLTVGCRMGESRSVRTAVLRIEQLSANTHI